MGLGLLSQKPLSTGFLGFLTYISDLSMETKRKRYSVKMNYE